MAEQNDDQEPQRDHWNADYFREELLQLHQGPSEDVLLGILKAEFERHRKTLKRHLYENNYPVPSSNRMAYAEYLAKLKNAGNEPSDVQIRHEVIQLNCDRTVEAPSKLDARGTDVDVPPRSRILKRVASFVAVLSLVSLLVMQFFADDPVNCDQIRTQMLEFIDDHPEVSFQQVRDKQGRSERLAVSVRINDRQLTCETTDAGCRVHIQISYEADYRRDYQANVLIKNLQLAESRSPKGVAEWQFEIVPGKTDVVKNVALSPIKIPGKNAEDPTHDSNDMCRRAIEEKLMLPLKNMSFD